MNQIEHITGLEIVFVKIKTVGVWEERFLWADVTERKGLQRHPMC